MNNTTTGFDNAIFISYTTWRVSVLICVLFGVPGHLFHILITLNPKNRKEATSLYFTAIAICELIYLFGLYKSNFLWRE